MVRSTPTAHPRSEGCGPFKGMRAEALLEPAGGGASRPFRPVAALARSAASGRSAAFPWIRGQDGELGGGSGGCHRAPSSAVAATPGPAAPPLLLRAARPLSCGAGDWPLLGSAGAVAAPAALGLSGAGARFPSAVPDIEALAVGGSGRPAELGVCGG